MTADPLTFLAGYIQVEDDGDGPDLRICEVNAEQGAVEDKAMGGNGFGKCRKLRKKGLNLQAGRRGLALGLKLLGLLSRP